MAQEDFEREFGTLLRTNPSYNKSTDFDSAVGGIEPIDQDVSKAQPKEILSESSKAMDLIKKNYKRGMFAELQTDEYDNEIKNAPSFQKWTNYTFNDDELDEAYEILTNEENAKKLNNNGIMKIVYLDERTGDYSVSENDFFGYTLVKLPLIANKHTNSIINHEMGHVLQHTIKRVNGQKPEAPDSLGNYGLSFYELRQQDKKKWAEKVNEPELIKLIESAKEENKQEIKEIENKLRDISKKEKVFWKKAFEHRKNEMDIISPILQANREVINEVQYSKERDKLADKFIAQKVKELGQDKIAKERINIRGDAMNEALYQLLNKKIPGLGDKVKIKDKVLDERWKIKDSLYKEQWGFENEGNLSDFKSRLQMRLDDARVGHVGSRFADFMSALHLGSINKKYRLDTMLSHPEEYYGYNREYANQFSSAEMFANYIEIRTNADKKYLNYLKKTFPTLINELDSSISDGLKLMKEKVKKRGK